MLKQCKAHAVAKLLAESQREQYQHDGIVFPVEVLSAEEVHRFRAASDELENRLGGKPRTVEVRQMHLHFPWACELALHPRVLDAVEDLLGPNLLIWATELFTKHPRDSAVSINWHQDRPYMGFQSGATASAWIALADSTPTNGCMRAVPGPGRYQARQTPRDEGQPDRQPRHRATAVVVHDEEVVDIVLRAGEMSLHDIDIVHGSGPNHSDEKRIGFVVRYVTPEARPVEGRPPAILARGYDPHGHFQLVDPPATTDTDQALHCMRIAAAQHLEAMLQNLKHVRTERTQ
jgi:non-haem Fe2+, alpha-ketoglutarate-dependent halogenase